MSGIRSQDDLRITTMIQNLLKLKREQEEGVIFSCGAFHAKRLNDEFKKLGLQNEVLYYFPHSSSRYDESFDDIEIIRQKSSGVLADHTHLLAQKDVQAFSKMVVREISGKTRYTREILEYHSHSRFLTDYFKTSFRAFLRPGYHVDALADADGSSSEIERSVSAAGISIHYTTLDGRNYLVIPNVNTRDIAERLRKM